MSLYQLGQFILNSGIVSPYKIECDALTTDDWDCLAYMTSMMVGPFHSVEGIPHGGLRFAKALEKYITKYNRNVLALVEQIHIHLIVDDVLTTGRSMNDARDVFYEKWRIKSSTPLDIKGAVYKSRGHGPEWIKVIFQMPECFWPKLQVQEDKKDG